ncbi:MAG: hypothetical protein ACXVLQ_04610 [Bacteriovorax sp.]
MISYETYKTLHLFFIMSFFASLGFVASDSALFSKKGGKIFAGLSSFLILAAGMGLIARLGYKHGQAFPKWINLKIASWFLINILFILLFKLKSSAQKALVSLVILLMGWATVWIVIHKPV